MGCRRAGPRLAPVATWTAISAINNRPILDLRTDRPVSHALDLTGLMGVDQRVLDGDLGASHCCLAAALSASLGEL
jgi:hypothetical protein